MLQPLIHLPEPEHKSANGISLIVISTYNYKTNIEHLLFAVAQIEKRSETQYAYDSTINTYEQLSDALVGRVSKKDRHIL